MIRFHVTGPIPRRISQDRAHVIVSRTTMFGIHRRSFIDGFDTDCTKSILMAFHREDDARKFMARIETVQSVGNDFDRQMVGYSMMSSLSEGYGGSKMPLKVADFPIRDLQQLCLFHFMDMYVVYDLRHVVPSSMMDVHCYEHVTNTYPNREMIVRYMQDMMDRGI